MRPCDHRFAEQRRLQDVVAATMRQVTDDHPDVAKAAARDDITDTLDYSAVAQAVKTVVIEGRFQLIETAAERVAERLIADYGLDWVRVEVVKPIPSEGYTAAIAIERPVRRAKLV